MQSVRYIFADYIVRHEFNVVRKVGMFNRDRAAQNTRHQILRFVGQRPVREQRGGVRILGVLVDHHRTGECKYGRGVNDLVRCLWIFPLGFDALIEIVVALNRVVSGLHEFQTLSVARLYDRLILSDAFEPLSGFLFAPHCIEPGEKTCFCGIEGNLPFKSRFA